MAIPFHAQTGFTTITPAFIQQRLVKRNMFDLAKALQLIDQRIAFDFSLLLQPQMLKATATALGVVFAVRFDTLWTGSQNLFTHRFIKAAVFFSDTGLNSFPCQRTFNKSRFSLLSGDTAAIVALAFYGEFRHVVSFIFTE